MVSHFINNTNLRATVVVLLVKCCLLLVIVQLFPNLMRYTHTILAK